MAVLFPGSVIASDAMPWMSTMTGREIDPNVWPLPDDAVSHPRSAGTFTRFLAQYVRDRKLISWPDAIAKTSYLPAKLLEETAPQMKKKGRLQVGMDADITVFDPAAVEDRAVRATEPDECWGEVPARQRSAGNWERGTRQQGLSRSARASGGSTVKTQARQIELVACFLSRKSQGSNQVLELGLGAEAVEGGTSQHDRVALLQLAD